MFLTLKTYNFNDMQHKVAYHKNVLTRERHELSMQVFHGTKIISALLVYICHTQRCQPITSIAHR